MAVESGLGSEFYIDGYDISGDVGQIQRISLRQNLLTKNSISQDGQRRISGRGDGQLAYNSWFDDATGMMFDALSGRKTADRIAMWFQSILAVNKPVACILAKQTLFDPQLGQDGSLAISVDALATGGGFLEWGRSLTSGKRTDTGADEGIGIDLGAALSLGFSAYLQVFDFTGTDATIKIQESSDDGDADAFEDVVGGAFSVINSAPVFERIETANPLVVEQYLRVVTTTSVGFSNLVFAVAVCPFAE